ncbi:MAG: phospho-sugar mutase [Thermoguttaceae bacterium]
MSKTEEAFDREAALAALAKAAADKKLSAGAVKNLGAWLSEDRYQKYGPPIVEHMQKGMWKELDDAFVTVIPFGTGGRRGRMYPIGSNMINERTIGESAQGLAEYVLEVTGKDRPAAAIAYDTRHRSREFAELCAGVFAEAGFQVWFLDGIRSTPELSFAVRYKQCDCGIMVTASHNPPSDNAVKAYWSTGGQLLPPHDKRVIERVMNVEEIPQVDFQKHVASGAIRMCSGEVDGAFRDAVAAQSRPGPRELKILYSPLHGVGRTAVEPALAAAGFTDVEIYGPHAEPSGDFPNVPGHVSNPENRVVFDAMIEYAGREGHDLILATDPDCDRVGCAVPVSAKSRTEWTTLTGNQIGALLADYLLETGKVSGTVTADHYIVKTLVTSELLRRVADRYGVRTIGDLLVGFKWIGGVMEQEDAEKFVLGAEESYGFLVGAHARDKDAAVASMLLAELAARLKTQGLTLAEKFDALCREHGCHVERTVSVTMPGAEGMERMKEVMAACRANPPREMAGFAIQGVRDYSAGAAATLYQYAGAETPLKGDLVMLDLAAEGNYVAVRPSGTEPKVKFYMFTYAPPAESRDVAAAREMLERRLDALEADLRKFAGVA